MVAETVAVVITDANILINFIHIGQLPLLGVLEGYLFQVDVDRPDAGDVAAAERVIQERQHIDRSRGVAPALRDAVAYHLAARRLAHSGGL